MKPAIAYIRVSTAKQGRSGLGLEAQQAALARFAAAEGFEFGQTFTETQSCRTADAGCTGDYPQGLRSVTVGGRPYSGFLAVHRGQGCCEMKK